MYLKIIIVKENEWLCPSSCIHNICTHTGPSKYNILQYCAISWRDPAPPVSRHHTRPPSKGLPLYPCRTRLTSCANAADVSGVILVVTFSTGRQVCACSIQVLIHDNIRHFNMLYLNITYTAKYILFYSFEWTAPADVYLKIYHIHYTWA